MVDYEKMYYLLKNEIIKNYELLGSLHLSLDDNVDRMLLGEYTSFVNLKAFCDNLEKKEI